MEESNTSSMNGLLSPTEGFSETESLAAAAAAASREEPELSATSPRKRKENPQRKDAYKSMVKACLEKDIAVNEAEALQKHIAALQKKLQEVQEREVAADAKVKTSFKELKAQGVEWNHHDTVWVGNYRELIEFQKQNPNQTVQVKTTLGKWVSRQRTLNGRMKEDDSTAFRNQTRFDMLEDVGFDWGKPRDPRVPWEERYQELLAFKNKFGHCNPTQYTEYHKLALFVKDQRRIYQDIQKGKTSRILTEERIRLLEEAGFEWRRHKYKNRAKKEAKTEASV